MNCALLTRTIQENLKLSEEIELLMAIQKIEQCIS